MAEMGSYCKAYRAEDLRKFAGWVEKAEPLVVRRRPSSEEEPERQNDNSAAEETSYFYLQENFMVTAGIFRDQKIAFDHVTDEWKEFCKNVLKFEVPSR